MTYIEPIPLYSPSSGSQDYFYPLNLKMPVETRCETFPKRKLKHKPIGKPIAMLPTMKPKYRPNTNPRVNHIPKRDFGFAK